MLKVEFNNLSKSPIRKIFLEKIAGETIIKSGVLDAKKKEISISFADVGEEKIKNLNKNFRKKNSPTDVLTFAEYGNQGEIKKIVDKKIFLGEIILCYNDIAKYCKKNKLVLEKELAKVVSHGVLHLLGFRHGKKMYKIQFLISNFEF
ncbi:MAG TPA: rRNA maturation RNase YbeY [Candidatus Moranbacteria bacterium]|nr:rRNA maturation RNase YbeY [Candidatus Moranbacteria bacterium]